MSGFKGHGTKRPDHSFIQSGREETGWQSYPVRNRRSRSVARNLPSLFSGKPDPSLNRDRVKSLNLSKAELKMREEQRAAKSAEARDIQELARRFATDAMQALADVLTNPDSADSAKITAANSILDRAYGKAASTNLNVNANMDANPKDLDPGDLDRRIADTLMRVENLADKAHEEAKNSKRIINLRDYN
jgi:hypothetical protein